MATPEVPPVNTPPMLDGRYCTKWSVTDAGSSRVSVGNTKNTATKVVIAAAVFRSNAPSASAVIPATVTYNAAPTTDRSAPGSDSDASRCCPLSTAWPTKNAAKLAISMVRSTTPANTASFPHNIGQPAGHHGQRGADHAGAVLTGDQQDAQHADGQLREEDAGQ